MVFTVYPWIFVFW